MEIVPKSYAILEVKKYFCHWQNELSFQTSFFTEIREIVRPEDLPRFDCLIYQRGNLLDKLLRGSGSGGRSKVVGSYDDDDQVITYMTSQVLNDNWSL